MFIAAAKLDQARCEQRQRDVDRAERLNGRTLARAGS
jgi:hypothetical protein